MKLVFFGTPSFSVAFLRALWEESAFDIVGVVTQPDKPAGRGNRVTPPPAKIFAEEYGIAVYQPATLKSPEAVEKLRSFDADAFVVVAYGKLIPAPLLSIPAKGNINVHPSLLPKYRGPSPMQTAIADGEDVTGVSIMLLDEGMDSGPLLASETIAIDDNETADTLAKKVERVGAPLLVETVRRYLAGEIVSVPQNHSAATVTKLLDREDGHIVWNAPLASIERKVRAFDPWPSTWAIWNRGGKDMRLKLLRVQPTDFKNDVPPGTVVVKNNRLFVDAADGTLEILTLQPEGKAAMDATSFLRGYTDIHKQVLR